MGEKHACQVPYKLNDLILLETRHKYTLWQCECQNVFEWTGSVWQLYSVDGYRIKNDLDDEND